MECVAKSFPDFQKLFSRLTGVES